MVALDQNIRPKFAPWSGSFSFAEAEQWAAFSGDYNPIHFEMARARSFGSDRLIVHGMVALMPFRVLIHDHFPQQLTSDGWWRMKAMFRKPVPQDTPLAVEHRIVGEGARYAMISVPSASDLIRVRYERHSPALDGAGHSLVEVPDERIAAFINAYGENLPAWMVADAAVFAGVVSSETDPIWDIVRREADRAWGEQAAPPMVVHAWHSVWHRCDAFVTGPPSALIGNNLSFSVESIGVDLVEDPQRQSMNCRIPLQIWLAGERIMIVEISLIIIKTSAGL